MCLFYYFNSLTSLWQYQLSVIIIHLVNKQGFEFIPDYFLHECPHLICWFAAVNPKQTRGSNHEWIQTRVYPLVLFVVYLSRSSVGNKICPLCLCDLGELAADAGPCQRRSQQVPVLIDAIGLDCRPDEVLHKLLTQVLDENLLRNKTNIKKYQERCD